MHLESGLALILIGLLMGLALYHFFLFVKDTDKRKEIKSLLDQLHAVNNEYAEYQANVDKHFEKSASLMHELQNSYRMVNEHLNGGAQQLAKRTLLKSSSQNPALARDNPALLIGQQSTDEPGDSNIQSTTLELNPPPLDPAASFEAPKDYAPKRNQSDTGTLSEDYGLTQSDKPPAQSAGH